MADYLFTLGRQPEISRAEIKALFAQKKAKYTLKMLDNTSARLNTAGLDAADLIRILGGTIKISAAIPIQKNPPETIVRHLRSAQPEGKIVFSLRAPDGKKITQQIKKELKKNGRSARYVEIKNTASILHNRLVKKQGDFTIVDGRLFVTRAVQPIEEFSRLDFDRPASDAKSGMLPPKLARIMLNLAQIDATAVILDPFCGSGTILMQAAAMGFTNLIGADISKKAVQDTQTNLEWQAMGRKINYRLMVAAAGQLDKTLKKNTIDAIVSEPYLGVSLRGRENKVYLMAQSRKLGELYADAFQTFHKILKPNGVVIFIIPAFKFNQEWINIDCLENIEKIGFQIEPLSDVAPCLRYWRPGQKLARQIWRFRKVHLKNLSTN